MKIYKIAEYIGFILLLTFLITSPLVSSKGTSTDLIAHIRLKLDQSPLGLVVFDDLHDNDYSATDLDLGILNLENHGYLAKLASEFTSWDEAVSKATYLVISAVYQSISSEDIQSVVDWFSSTSGNLLLASRGDFNAVDFTSMNALLAQLSASVRIQDDNVYTSNPSARADWYVESTIFNSANFSSLFSGVFQMNFFSPSSVTDTEYSEIIVWAESQSYQTDQGGNPPQIVYDNIDDGSGGDQIPLSVFEEVQLGSEVDRIILTGTTMWSDFDYGDPDNNDPSFFHNIIDYFREETLSALGTITVDIPDTDAPRVKIEYPHNQATLMGTVKISTSAVDAFGVSTTEIYLDGELVSSSSSYDWDTTTSTSGSHTVLVEVTDPSGNTGQVSHTYSVDQTFQPHASLEPKFMTYNIKQSGAIPAWKDVVKEEDADLFILVETGDFDNDNDAILNEVRTELNEYFFDKLPYEVYTLQGIDQNYNGISLFSRFTILYNEMITTVTSDTGSNTVVPLPFLHASIEIDAEEVQIIGIHLTAGPNGKSARNTQTEGILNFADTLGDVPLIMMGDFNAESPEDIGEADSDLGTEAIDMIITPSNTKSSTVHSFVDVHHELNPSDPGTSYTTFPARIDYIFVNQYFAEDLVSSSTGDTFSALIASDHFPVDVVLDLHNFGNIPAHNSGSTSLYSDNPASNQSPLSFPISFLIPSVLVMIYINRKRH